MTRLVGCSMFSGVLSGHSWCLEWNPRVETLGFDLLSFQDLEIRLGDRCRKSAWSSWHQIPVLHGVDTAS